MKSNSRLIDLRHEIERLTLEIVELAGKRTNLAREVGVEKRKAGIALVNREVERKLRKKVVEHCVKNNQDSNFALKILNELIIESIRTQDSQIDHQEPENAYHIFVKANELQKAGKEIIHLEVGEPDFGPPVAVAETLTKSTLKGHAGYTQSSGILELRQKIADYVNQSNHSEISADQVIVTVGCRFALHLGLVTTLRSGDEVVVIDPSYPGYSDCIKQAGGRPVHVATQLEDNWNLDIELLEEAISKTTRMIILNSPSNPTGKTLDWSTLDKIAEISVESEIRIVSDEVYSEFSFTPFTSMLQFPDCDQIHVSSFSKTFGMTGFRLGYAISDVETVQRMTQLQNVSLTSVPEFIQYAGITALECLDESKGFASVIKERQASTIKHLERIPVSFHRPDGGFYIFPRLDSEDEKGLDFADRLLSDKGVAVVPGISYGREYSRFFRISVCQTEELLIEAVSRMEEILS